MHGFVPLNSAARNAAEQPLFCEGALETEMAGIKLWLASPTPQLLPTPKELIAAYLDKDLAFLTQLNGAATLLLVDERKDKTILAVDPMGIASMAYSVLDSGVHFSVSPIEVAKRTGQTEISRQQIFDYLFFHMIPAPQTIFSGVSKMLPAEALVIEKSGVERKIYWRAHFRPDFKDDAASQAHLRKLLGNAIERHTGLGDVGAFLSGGLDSSTVSGYLSQKVEKAKTFSIGFGVAEYDELPYARMANTHFGCQGHEFVALPEHITENFSAIATRCQEPFGNSSVVPTLLCAKFAKSKGVNHLLAGDGGDELFAGNERYARQKVFELYGRIPRFLRSNVLNPMARFIDPESALTPLRKFRSYVDQASIPLPRRFESWNYAYREGVSSMLSAEFAQDIDLDSPMLAMEVVFQQATADDLVDRMLAYDWKFTLADSDLPKVTSMCALGDVGVSFPMLDRELVEFSTQIAGSEKLDGQNLRSFFKTSLKDFLPEQIIDKPKHGFGLPFGVWLQQEPQLASMINARLSDLKTRGIFQPTFLDNLIEEQKAGHASYIGYFVWDLAMLEAWLSAHELAI